MTTSTKPPRQRFVALDFLRGVAAIGVLARHAFPVSVYTDPLPYLVDFFFVLSGFVLEPIYPNANNFVKGSKNFILKRIVRFWPMVICVLTAQFIREVWFNSNITHSAISVVLAYALLQVFSMQSAKILYPLWSLSAEWIVNVLSIPFTLHRKYLSGFVLIILGYCMMMPALLHNGFQSSIHLPITGFPAIGRAVVGIGIGLTLRIFFRKFNDAGKRLPTFFAFVATASLFILVVLSHFVGIKVLWIAAICFAPLIFLVAMNNERLFQSRFRNFAVIVGELSFGIYAWHYVFVEPFGSHQLTSNLWVQGILNFIVMLTLAVIATLLTQKFVERPVQNYFKRRQMSATLPESSR